MDYVAGVDSGSTTTKLVILDNSRIFGHHVIPTGSNCVKASQNILEIGLKKLDLDREDIKYIVATGYGRQQIDFAQSQVTEISCHAKGIHSIFPHIKVIIDIGGQDFKVIKLSEKGQVIDFAMNDKCAAGTGRYLELMSRIFEMELEQFGRAAAFALNKIDITSYCTVFAETEVINHISRGTPENDIIAGIFHAVAKRLYSMAKHYIGSEKEIAFTGGVSKYAGMIKALEDITGCSVLVPSEPQITGALGAALFALEKLRSNN